MKAWIELSNFSREKLQDALWNNDSKFLRFRLRNRSDESAPTQEIEVTICHCLTLSFGRVFLGKAHSSDGVLLWVCVPQLKESKDDVWNDVLTVPMENRPASGCFDGVLAAFERAYYKFFTYTPA